ncbi:hypothetical protein ACIQ9E_03525 [Streptomyces sp. NPDC094448]
MGSYFVNEVTVIDVEPSADGAGPVGDRELVLFDLFPETFEERGVSIILR